MLNKMCSDGHGRECCDICKSIIGMPNKFTGVPVKLADYTTKDERHLRLCQRCLETAKGLDSKK